MEGTLLVPYHSPQGNLSAASAGGGQPRLCEFIVPEGNPGEPAAAVWDQQPAEGNAGIEGETGGAETEERRVMVSENIILMGFKQD